MISPLPGATTTKPGSATFPLPGISAEVVDDQGKAGRAKGGGYLTLTRPWPGDAARHLGRPERYQETYWSRTPIATSPATALGSTTTGTSGCSVGSTT